MSVTPTSTALKAAYDALATFRSSLNYAQSSYSAADLAALEDRILSFQSAASSTPVKDETANADADYPYDEASLKKEFMDEVTAFLLSFHDSVRRSDNNNVWWTNYAASTYASHDATWVNGVANQVGGGQWAIADLPVTSTTQPAIGNTQTPPGTTFDDNFANYKTDLSNPNNDERYTKLLNESGKVIWLKYLALINQAFSDGDNLAKAASQSAQIISAIPALTVDGVTYDKLSTMPVTTVTTDTSTGKYVSVTTFTNYLVDSTALPSDVEKNSAGKTTLDGVTTGSKQLELSPQAAAEFPTGTYSVNIGGTSVSVSFTGGLTGSLSGAMIGGQAATVAKQTAIILNIPGSTDQLAATNISCQYTVSLSGKTYLVGLTNEKTNRLFITSLNAGERALTSSELSPQGGTNPTTSVAGTMQTFSIEGGTCKIEKTSSGTPAFLFFDSNGLEVATGSLGITLVSTPAGSSAPITYAHAVTIKGNSYMIGSTANGTIHTTLITTAVRTAIGMLMQPTILGTHAAGQAIIDQLGSQAGTNSTTVLGGTTYSFSVDGKTYKSLGYTNNGLQYAFFDDTGASLTVSTLATPVSVPISGTNVMVSCNRTVVINGKTYLLGSAADGTQVLTLYTKEFRTTATADTHYLSGVEYLFYYNETRVKILRAQLASKEAVVREIQDDLKKANDALAALEQQAGQTQQTSSDGKTVNPNVSAETDKLEFWNATASTAKNSIMERSTNNTLHNYTDWQQSRVSLKNYIDRRSSQAQQATLDYQNVLNRYNSAYEIMGKLQEKLDTLLKGQLRNI